MREDRHTNTPEAAAEYEQLRGSNSDVDDRPTRTEIAREER